MQRVEKLLKNFWCCIIVTITIIIIITMNYNYNYNCNNYTWNLVIHNFYKAPSSLNVSKITNFNVIKQNFKIYLVVLILKKISKFFIIN